MGNLSRMFLTLPRCVLVLSRFRFFLQAFYTAEINNKDAKCEMRKRGKNAFLEMRSPLQKSVLFLTKEMRQLDLL